MPRDSRDRVAEASPVPVERANDELADDSDVRGFTPEELRQYQASQVVGGVEGKLAHELPPQVRPEDDPRFYADFWLNKGLSDAEAILIANTLRQKNGGLVEYDEDAEAERLAKIRAHQQRLSRVDGGDSIQAQISAVEAYFVGAVPRGDGKYCVRKPYMSPRDEKIWINGYHFSIPKHTRVVIPTEVIDLLDAAAKSRGDFDVVSAAFQARQFDPINMHEGVIPTPAEMAPRTLEYYREPRHGTAN